MGKFGQWLEENAMYGMTPRTLKANPSLIPIFGCIVSGVFIAFGYTLRYFIRNPNVSHDLMNNREPWNRYRDREYRFFNISGIKPPCLAPEYRREGDPPDQSYELKMFPRH